MSGDEAPAAESTRSRPFPWARATGRLRRLRRLLPAIVPALIVALPPLFWVLDATNRASLTTLGRDQGIFQYLAWALEHGAKDYRDVRDVNGPLTHLIHLVFLHLGGADEHRFRVLDLTFTGLCFAGVGACLPGLSLERDAPYPSFAERIAWGFASLVVLGAQYMHYIFW